MRHAWGFDYSDSFKVNGDYSGALETMKHGEYGVPVNA
jgi:hypothetical protein